MDYGKLYKKALERASKLRFQNPFDTVKVHYASTKALDDCIDWLKSLKQRMEE